VSPLFLEPKKELWVLAVITVEERSRAGKMKGKVRLAHPR